MDYLNLFWKRKQFLFVLSLLIIANCATIFLTDLTTSRQIRLASTILFLGFYLTQARRNTYVLIALVCFVLKDVFIQEYESFLGHLGYLFFGIVAYGALIIERLPRLRTITINRSLVLISVLLIAANTYTLHIIMDMIGHRFDTLSEVLVFYMYGAFMMIIAVVAVAYNNTYNSNRSLLFLFLVVAYMVSDTASLFAYYFGVDFCYYLDRVAYLLGFAFLMNYGLNFSLLRAEKTEHIFLQHDENSDDAMYAFAKADPTPLTSIDAKASLYTFIKQD